MINQSHTEILNNLFKHKEVLREALELPYVWIRNKELIVDDVTKERADLVFQDMFDAYQGLPDATCYILELKKDCGDHELLGQIKKYMNAMERKIKYGHWGRVEGLAVAKHFTDSGLKLLWKEKIRTFLYSEDQSGNPKLQEVKIQRRAIMTEENLNEYYMCNGQK